MKIHGSLAFFFLRFPNKKTILLLNLAAVAVFCIVAFSLVLPLLLPGFSARQALPKEQRWILWLIFPLGYLAYIVLHELAHGVAYRALTGEKLTYGFTLSVAFCGVPHIYVSRKTSLIASATPLVVFGILLGGAAAVLFFYDTVLYMVVAWFLSAHLCGCVGDLWVISTLLFRLRDPETLVRDTGPKQTFLIKQDKSLK